MRRAPPRATWATGFTTPSLFPFYFSGPPANYTNNYGVWAGGCLQERPPTGYDTTTVNPGVNSLDDRPGARRSS